MPMMSGTSSPSLYSVHDFLNKLFFGRVEPPTRPKPAAPCLPCMRSIFDAIFDAIDTCVPITFQHRIATPGEWTLSALVHQQRVRIPAVVELSAAERRAFAALGSRGSPTRYVAAESWRDVAEDSLERWWCEAHGATAKDLRFELAREQTLRGLPRIRRGGGAGELLWEPVPSADTPVELRGISHAWLRAFFVWMHLHRLFKLPVRVFAECFATLLTTPHACPLYDFVPVEYRCAPRTFSCHAWDDELYAVLAANMDAPWLSLFAVGAPPLGRERKETERLVAHVPACVAACSAGLVFCLPGRGEPANALRPLHRAWCVLELCCALAGDVDDADTDPYDSAPRRVRFAFGGVDDDVERHRAIAQALQDLSWDAASAHDPIEAEVLQDALLEARGEAEVQMRDAVRRAFARKYSLPQHMHIRALYAA